MMKNKVFYKLVCFLVIQLFLVNSLGMDLAGSFVSVSCEAGNNLAAASEIQNGDIPVDEK